MGAYLRKYSQCSVVALLLLLLVSFCTPFTAFEEASAYLADTENELVHYYLTPLPDNGEACTDPPRIALAITKTIVKLPVFHFHTPDPACVFFHPPK